MQSKYQTSLDKAIRFVIKQSTQECTTAEVHLDRECTNLLKTVDVYFPLALVLHSIGLCADFIDKGEVSDWLNKNLSYLKDSHSNYSYNYWVKSTPANKQNPLPDDVDDTACALVALLKNNIEIDERFFLRLISLEVAPGGPYRTWYVGKNSNDKWMDIDPAVNAHLLYFAAAYGIKLKGAEEYLVNCFKNSTLKSPYYLSELITVLYASRFAFTDASTTLKAYIKRYLEKTRYSKLDSFEKLLYCINYLYVFEEIAEDKIEEMLKMQKRDGSLPLLAICMDYPIPSTPYTYTASPIISTAFFLEFLYLVLKREPIGESSAKIKKQAPWIQKIQIKQKALIQIELKKLNLPKNRALKFFDIEKNERALTFPFLLAMDLKPNLKQDDINNLENLSAALYFGWLNYTLMDKIIDGELGAEFIPICLSLNKLNWDYLYRINFEEKSKFIHELELSTFISNKNYYFEATELHFNNRNLQKILSKPFGYKYILNRMEAYIKSLSLIPQILDVDKVDSKLLYKFFQSQIIISQLNDDAHDWEEDEKEGILTYVVYLLYKANRNPKTHKSILWGKVMEEISVICTREYKKAKALGKTLKLPFLDALLEKTYSPIRKADSEVAKVKNMIQYFK